MSQNNRRKGHIPGTLVLNWKSGEAPNGKSSTRRPMTACEACRTAKVKCDAQRDCSRCKLRGLGCRYITRGSVANNEPRLDFAGCSQASPVQEAVHGLSDPSSNIDSGFLDDLSLHNASKAMEWGEDAFNKALEQFDWVFPDDNIDTSDLHRENLLEDPICIPENYDQSPNTLALPDLVSLPSVSSHENTSACQCRMDLIAHVPLLEDIMQEKPKPRLDAMLKVTEDVTASCQSAINCKRCKIGPVDLVCIVTVFQQTAACFDHIAKSSLDGSMKVGVGSYEVSLTDDITFKRMLVMNHIKQANTLLDSMNIFCQNLCLSQDGLPRNVMNRSPACLNQLNLNYVREVTTNFRTFFRLITDVFEE
ncbi:hypothetical protein N7509_002058 [Penicillium cosmopolitanum]|uniref:Zn(2)-C6 fungal-type domain-containing protein n=1 Tax=Penicillium cosmopolitanum TaxID=1131564 RepID=A0A9W9W8P5_9EURO|nr:uncharacterized protein N7509_002058 [Penicillium cosmopolitanum]KAJ5408175.1 hypothetical protein N7509_002058 [Penicillium cosmopolitanum]